MNIIGGDLQTRLMELQVSLNKETRDAETTTELNINKVTYVDASTGSDLPILLIDSSTSPAPALVMKDAGTVTESDARILDLEVKEKLFDEFLVRA